MFKHLVPRWALIWKKWALGAGVALFYSPALRPVSSLFAMWLTSFLLLLGCLPHSDEPYPSGNEGEAKLFSLKLLLPGSFITKKGVPKARQNERIKHMTT